jgi:hypothetical protein
VSGEGSHVSRSSNLRSIQLVEDGLLRQVTESFSFVLRQATFPHNISKADMHDECGTLRRHQPRGLVDLFAFSAL